MAILDSSEPLEGDTVTARETTLRITVSAGLDRQLLIVKNGEPLGERVVIDADPFEYELSVSAPSEGEDRYRVEVLEGASRLTITSHVWVKRPPGSSSSGGGCSAAGGPGGATALIGLALALLALGRRRARG
jgi:uncharacterized protein (TIGR03382 family)